MRLKVTDEEAKKVALVLLDNKVVPYPLEFDTKEGWVEAMTPQLEEKLKIIDSEDSGLYSDLQGYENNEDPMINASTPKFDWNIVKLKGEVKIIWKEEEKQDATK